MLDKLEDLHGSCRVEHSHFANKKFLRAMAILEKISLVALAIFAAYTSLKLFIPFLMFGIALGAYLNWGKKEHHHHHHDDGGGCSQGFIEQLTGVKLPPPLGLAANIAITVCHIDHHASVFVPLIGLNAGMWLGKLLGENVPLFYKKFTPIRLQGGCGTFFKNCSIY